MKIKIRLSTIIFVIIIIAIIVSNFLPDKVKSTNIFGGKKYNSSANLEILNVYVSTTGNDSNNGLSEASAKKTIASAVEVAKQHINTKNVVINLGSGNYYISEPININNETTCGQNGGTLTLASANKDAIINGGMVITNTWSQSVSNSNIWTVQLDKSRFPDVTGLYVNDEMKQMASRLVTGTPTLNTTETDIESAYLSIPETELSYEDISEDLQNMFIEHYWEWKKSTFRISSVESETNNLKLNYTADTIKAIKNNKAIDKMAYPPKYNQQTSKHYIVNALCALDEEGEYYYDKSTGVLSYYSMQNPNNEECVIPSTEGLLTIQGTENKLASNVEIKNIIFKYGMSSMEHKEYWDEQAESGMIGEDNTYHSKQKIAQINLKYASNVKFDGCNFKNINTACIAVNDYCYNVDVSNNNFNGIGGSAVRIGTVDELTQNTQKDKRPLLTDFENVYSVSNSINYMPCKINVENNQMTDISQNYISSPAVIIYFANTVDIKQNSFNNCTYSAISAGWGWVNSENTYITKSSGKINIEGNRLEHIMTKAFDGAPIYTLGIFGDGITITKNYINTNESENGYHGGIYLDEGTENAVVTYNVVADCMHWIDARALMSAEATPTVKTIRNTTITNNYSNTTPPDKAYDKWVNGGRISAHLVEGANTIYENNSVGQTTWNSEATEIINNSGAKAIPTTEINPESITLNKTTSTLDLNGTKTEQLSAMIAPTNANINTGITWTSSNTEVADVSSTGLVTAKAKGTTTITARTGNGKTATCEVTVINTKDENQKPDEGNDNKTNENNTPSDNTGTNTSDKNQSGNTETNTSGTNQSGNTGTNASGMNQSGSTGTTGTNSSNKVDTLNRGISANLNSTDGSLATNKLPHTGQKGILYIITTIVAIFAIMSYTRWKRYQEIK